ncbi:MAG: hypothetical protein WDA59_07310 [Methanofastidiosum sp.]|jgi:hypothetical protein
MTIERSAGIPATINGVSIPCYPLPGGGYSGKTKELDDLVEQAAKLMQQIFNQDIEIRFNSDRKSGKAFLKGIEDSIGLGARITKSGIVIDTVVDGNMLKDISFATVNSTYFNDHTICYCSKEHSSLEEGLNWILQVVDRNKIKF